ncbi:T9SS type A sorting domain-containing protein [Candidatus Kapabacteria bacterium]|nr:T9SS type A sorting domain-containing protein [Candidatus Kapabacteria bacterium]
MNKYLILAVFLPILLISSPIEFRIGEQINYLDGSNSDVMVRSVLDNYIFDLSDDEFRFTLFKNFNENNEDYLEYESINFEILFDKQETIENTLGSINFNKFTYWNATIPKRIDKLYKNGIPNNIEIYDYVEWKAIDSRLQRFNFKFFEFMGNIKYDIELSNKNLNKLKIKLNKPAYITDSGELLVKGKLGNIISERPISYLIDENSGTKSLIDLEYSLSGDTLGFVSKSILPKNSRIIIDPVLRVESSYYGGLDDDRFYDMDRDAAGNYYLTGITSSAGKIAFNGHQTIKNNLNDAFLVKINPEGNRVWASYYGGDQIDIVYGIGVSPDGDIAIVGETLSDEDIATSGSHQEELGGGSSDGFIAYFNTDGERQWASYYGGLESDKLNDVVLDNFGNSYAVGFTRSEDNIAFDGYQNIRNGNSDGFMVKFNPLGQRRWGSYYGGSENDYINSIDLDENGNIYVCGTTQSSSNIALNGYKNNYTGAFDAFISKFDASGDLTWASYFGGTKDETANSVNYHNGNVVLAGSSQSNNIAIGGNQTSHGGSYDGYFALFDDDGNFKLSSYFGGSQNDDISSAYLSDDALYVCGYTRSDNNISFNAYQEFRKAQFDASFAKYNLDGTIEYGSYYGGSESDFARSIRIDSDTIFVAGYSNSSSDIADNGYQNFNSGSDDGIFIFLKDQITPKINANFQELYCGGESYSVEFDLVGDFPNKVNLRLELSDKNGNFQNSQLLKEGEFSSDITNLFDFNISNTLSTSSLYKIKIVSDNPKAESNSTESITILAPVKISGLLDRYCVNKDYYLNANTINGSTYEWILPNGNRIENVNRININHNNSGTYTYKLIQNCFGCISEIEFDIELIDTPIISITPNDDVCRYDTVNYQLQYDIPRSNFTLEWKLFDAKLISGDLKLSDNLDVRLDGDNPRIEVTVYEKGTGCVVEETISINYYENIIPKILGPEKTCKNCTENYKISDIYSSYNWEIEGGEIVTNNDAEITVKWGNESVGELKVFVENSFGCKSADDINIVLSDNIEISISPEINFICIGDSTEFSTSSATFLNNNWEIEGGEILNQTENSVTIFWNEAGKSTLYLTQINNNTSTTQTENIEIDVLAIPELKISSSTINYCIDQTSVLEFETIPGLQLQANIENGIIDKIDGNKVEFRFTKIGVGEITVSGQVGNNGCKGYNSSTFLIAENTDEVQLDLIKGIISSSKPAYFLLNNSVLLNESPALEYTPSENGNYSAYTLDMFGCKSEISNTIFINYFSVMDLPEYINIYPNPADNILNINSKYNINLKLIDINGNTLIDLKNINKTSLDISKIYSGFYLIEIQNKNIYYREKLIIK